MNWHDLNTYFKKTRFSTSQNELDNFIYSDLKDSNLKYTIPYDDENESSFRPRRNLNNLYEDSEEPSNYTAIVFTNQNSEYFLGSQPNKKQKLSS